MSKPSDRPLPHWPALMETAVAADYVSLCERNFRVFATRAGVAPVDLGFRATRWRKSDIDAALELAPSKGSGDETPNLAEVQAEALARAARRAGRRK